MERAEIRNDVLRFLSTLEEVLEPWQDWLTLVHGLYLQGKFRELEIERDHGQAILDRLQGFLQERSRYLSRLREQGIVVGGLKDALIYGGGTNEEVKQLERYSLRMQTLRQQSLALWILAFQCMEHTSQVLQILSTGEAKESTYGNNDSESISGGRLVNQAA
ncbi:MAG: hypothetical protein U0905_19315 [Pirellulales bacterium]